MKISRKLLVVALAGFGMGVIAQEEKERSVPAVQGVLFKVDFEDREPGNVPDDYFVIEGDWSVVELDGGKVMKLAESPLVEASVQVGPSLKTGGIVSARIKAERKRRSFPRFGIGLHGISGFKLRLVPSHQKLELSKGGLEEPVQTANFEWRSEEWFYLELLVVEAGDAWTISGRAWAESDERPKQAQVEYIATNVRLTGRGSVTGTAYAGLPIYFDDIEIRKGEPESNE